MAKSDDFISSLNGFLTDDELYMYLLSNYAQSYFKTFIRKLLNEKLNINFIDSSYYDKILNSECNFCTKLCVLNSIKNENLKVKYILSLIERNPGIRDLDSLIIQIIFLLKNDENKLKLIAKLSTPSYVSMAFLSINNKQIKLKNINFFTPNDLIKFLITLSDEEKLMYLKTKKFEAKVFATLKKDALLREIDFLSDTQKVSVILLVEDNFTRFELLKKYRYLFSDEDFRNYMFEIYHKAKDLKSEIMNLFSNDIVQRINYSNTILGKRKLLSPPSIFYDLKFLRKYSFGVELESAVDDYLIYSNLKRMLSSWHLKGETSVKNGLEITSPILHYTKGDLGQLEYVCSFLHEIGAIQTNECGGHVHIGFDFFKSIEELQNLYMLYCSNENLFSFLANRENSIIRPNIIVYASSISEKLEKAILSGTFNRSMDMFEFVKTIKDIQGDRLVNLNLFNAYSIKKNTIEFRASNGEDNYRELLLNIILYLKLVDLSIELARFRKGSPAYDELQFLISQNSLEIDRVKEFLHLFFGNNQELIDLFLNRYETNSEINKYNSSLIRTRNKVEFK